MPPQGETSFRYSREDVVGHNSFYAVDIKRDQAFKDKVG